MILRVVNAVGGNENIYIEAVRMFVSECSNIVPPVVCQDPERTIVVQAPVFCVVSCCAFQCCKRLGVGFLVGYKHGFRVHLGQHHTGECSSRAKLKGFLRRPLHRLCGKQFGAMKG